MRSSTDIGASSTVLDDGPSLDEAFREYFGACGHCDTMEHETRLEGATSAAQVIDPSISVRRFNRSGKRSHTRAPDQVLDETDLLPEDVDTSIHIYGEECRHAETRRCIICVTQVDLMDVAKDDFKEIYRRRGVIVDEIIIRMKRETAFALGFI